MPTTSDNKNQSHRIIAPCSNCDRTNIELSIKRTNYHPIFDINKSQFIMSYFYHCGNCGTSSLLCYKEKEDFPNNYIVRNPETMRSRIFINQEYLANDMRDQAEFVASDFVSDLSNQPMNKKIIPVYSDAKKSKSNAVIIHKNIKLSNPDNMYKKIEYAIIRSDEYKKLDRCVSCDVIDYKDWLDKKLIPFYNEQNKKLYVCSKCKSEENARQLYSPYFGFNFRDLKGKGKSNNPFDRLVGIELETVGGNSELSYFDLPKELMGNLACKFDGSLYDSNFVGEEDDENSPVNRDDYWQDDDHDNRGVGREFILIPLGKNKLMKTIDNVTKFLRDNDFTINKSCGFHCHFDMRQENYETVRKTFLIYSLFEKQLFDMLPKSRRKNRYCMPLKKNYFDFFNLPADNEQQRFERYWYNTNNSKEIEHRKQHKYEETRYASINYHALFFHGTLENRIHSGTINANKIKKWVLINQILIDFAKQTPMKKILKITGDKNTFFHIISLYEKKYPQLIQYNLIEYVNNRMHKFADHKSVRPTKIINSIKPNQLETDLLVSESIRLLNKD